MKRIYTALIFVFLSVSLFAQAIERPRLVVGIVVDQMRYDYLYRYYDKYSENGLKKLLREGFSFTNMKYNYAPTYTAPGHAAIYTGCTPSINGIVANDWYNRNTKKNIYCVSDTTVTGVGADNSNGKMSPRNLFTTTVTDELRLHTNFKSKVIGISLKDRGSILPAGHTANAAYWFDTKTGKWITSTYYMDNLPAWVINFNNKKRSDYFLKQKWEPINKIENYIHSTADSNAYETPLIGRITFPYDLSIPEASYITLPYTPYGNEFTKEFIFQALINEKLGKSNGVTDFLAVSFSAPDNIGHQFGINSIEIEDAFIRFDKIIEEIINFLNSEVGEGNYIFFLTADHGAAHNPTFLKDKKIPAGNINDKEILDSLNLYLSEIFNEKKLITEFINLQVYLNRDLIIKNKLNEKEIVDAVVDYFLNREETLDVLTSEMLYKNEYTLFPRVLVQRGFYKGRSGDVIIITKPGYIDWRRTTGTTHGSPYLYDTHVPFILYGWNIKKGTSNVEAYITDIAPTLSSMLKISFPGGATGRPLDHYFTP